jgi:hypothetical protein
MKTEFPSPMEELDEGVRGISEVIGGTMAEPGRYDNT